jgi:hypothetical protein
MFSAWALEVTQIKGAVSIIVLILGYICLFVFSVLIWSFVYYTARYPLSLTFDHFCYFIYPTVQTSRKRSHCISTFDSSLKKIS